MVDDLYVVGLDFRQLGTPSILKPDAESRMRRMQSRMDMFRQGWRDFSSGGGDVMRVLDGVAGSIARIGMIGGTVMATAGIAGLTHATIGLQSELEKTTISLGTMFSAEGQAHNLNQGLALAAGTIRDMREDAQRLPGEFEDLLHIFKLGAIPAFQSGLDINSWRELSSKVMATGVIAQLGGGLPQVAREMTMLLQGRAGAHNVFGHQLGLSGEKAQAFNKMTAPERVKALDEILSRYGESIPVFEKSWDAASAAFVGSVKLFALTATEPLFEKVKQQVREANQWFDENKETVDRYASIIGMRLGEAWEFGKAKVLEWGPVLLQFVDNASDRLGAIWTEIEPGVVRIGELLQEALKDPGTIDKMILLAKLWLGLKAGGMLLGAGQAAWGIGSGAAGMLGGAAGGLRSAAAWGAGGLISAGGGIGGGFSTGAALGSVAAAAGSVVLALGSLGIAADQAYKLWSEHFAEGKSDADMNRAAFAKDIERSALELPTVFANPAAELSDKFLATSMNAGQAADVLRDLYRWGFLASDETKRMAEALGYTTANVDQAAIAMFDLKEQAYAAAAALEDIASTHAFRMDQVFDRLSDLNNAPSLDPNATAAEQATYMATLAAQRALNDPNFLKPPGEHAAHHKGGGGGTKIQKVEIVVTSNQSPSRIAREVVGELGKLSRTPTTSKYVPNFSGVSRS